MPLSKTHSNSNMVVKTLSETANMCEKLIILFLFFLSFFLFRRQGSSCTFADNFPSGYTTSCQQKYIYRKLLALGEDGRAVTDSFRLPSCCSCVVTKLF